MDEPSVKQAFKALLVILFCVVLIVGLGVGGVAGCKSFNRSQKRADANNKVKLTHIAIQTAQQQAQITNAQIATVKARAEMRYQEAIGIRKAQDEISSTLTPMYLQHEAIKNLATANRVYIPSGANGVPMVNDVGK